MDAPLLGNQTADKKYQFADGILGRTEDLTIDSDIVHAQLLSRKAQLQRLVSDKFGNAEKKGGTLPQACPAAQVQLTGQRLTHVFVVYCHVVAMKGHHERNTQSSGERHRRSAIRREVGMDQSRLA